MNLEIRNLKFKLSLKPDFV